nr:MAG TPA: DNA polymerase family B [Caudoviricetes sp.]
MLTELCRECRNWFTSREDKHVGDFTISNGVVSPSDFLLNGQFFRVVGSHFNDGVYRNVPESLSSLTDEVFTGQIWAMCVPPAFVALDEEIEEFNKKTASASGPYSSESWGGYSYTLATGATGGVITWQEAFAKKLNTWRKL